LIIARAHLALVSDMPEVSPPSLLTWRFTGLTGSTCLWRFRTAHSLPILCAGTRYDVNALKVGNTGSIRSYIHPTR
jgi:hypothetical protein